MQQDPLPEIARLLQATVDAVLALYGEDAPKGDDGLPDVTARLRALAEARRASDAIEGGSRDGSQEDPKRRAGPHG